MPHHKDDFLHFLRGKCPNQWREMPGLCKIQARERPAKLSWRENIREAGCRFSFDREAQLCEVRSVVENFTTETNFDRRRSASPVLRTPDARQGQAINIPHFVVSAMSSFSVPLLVMPVSAFRFDCGFVKLIRSCVFNC